MKKEMLINCLQPEEIRIAILEDGILEELYVERASHESYVGNIYKGRVVNIEPSIQAAFIDFGVGRNGFLHVSDVEPAYYRDIDEPRGRRGERGGRGRPPRGYDDRGGPPRGHRSERTERDERGPESRRRDDYPPQSPADFSPFGETPSHEGREIITHEVHEPDDSYHDAPEPPGTEAASADWPPPSADAPLESGFDAAEELPSQGDSPGDRAEPQGAFDDPESDDAPGNDDPEPTAQGDDPAADTRPPRRGGRRGRGRGGRGRRSRRGPRDDGGPSGEQPRPRPMDSSERRIDEHDESLRPIEPRPAPSKADWSDDELSFSSQPLRAEASPSPQASSSPTEEIIVQEEEFIEPDEPLSETEEISSAPMEPAIPKVDPTESFEDLVEEEKAMEEEDEVAVSHFGAEEQAQPEAEEDFSNLEPYEPRDRGDRGRGQDDRRGRGRDDRRGGRGRGRDDHRGGGRGPRGGRDAGRRMGGRPGFGRPKPNIEDIFKRGQEVLVQVIKEGIGTKGPTLSTYISIAGRYLVLMPGLNRIGVSRKIEDDETRRRLREIMNDLRPPRGIGFIIRTAGQDRNRQELQSDLAYLSRLWQVVVRRIQKQKSPTEIYRESDMVTRTIRDIFMDDIDTIWVDERGAYEAAKEFMEAVMPRYAERIKFYDSTMPMFHKYGVENEIARIQERKISLPNGGSIVIDQTEALVAIDVNSGSFRADNQNAEETAYQMNLHAAKEIARQLRLRDLGGVIANDFIDMREDRHRRNVEKALHDAVRRDRARTKILRISQFGVIEMTRQRIRPSLKRSAFQDCPHCKSTGHVKTAESVSIEIMRMLQLAVNRIHISRIDIRVHDDVAMYLLNKKRKEIGGLEEVGKKAVSISSAGAAVSPEFLEFMCYDNNGSEVKFTMVDEPPPRPPQRRGRR